MTAKKSTGAKLKTRRPTVRQAAFVEGIIEGKSSRRAALDAGYSLSSAAHANDEILGSVEKSFGPVLREAIPVQRIVQRLSEGLDAVEVRTATREGAITDRIEIPDYAERRATAELVTRLGGHYIQTDRIEVSRRELSGAEVMSRLLGPEPEER